MAGNILKIATPISHLLEAQEAADRIVQYSDCLECRDQSFGSVLPLQEIFHCEKQPIHKLSKADFNYIEKIRRSKPELKLITFHLASSCSAPVLKDCMFMPGGTMYTRDEMVKNSLFNFTRIKSILGQDIQIGVENNNFFPTKAYEFVTDATFISEIVCGNDIWFLFDISHARITAHNAKINYNEYKEGLPLDRTIQMHICRTCSNEQDLAYDTHEYPNVSEWDEVRELIRKYNGIKYLTVEYYKNTEGLIRSLKELKGIINELS